jgi:UDP-3-O-[3-hydroxymyristoyl] N-acetylglucosamine deacetylase
LAEISGLYQKTLGEEVALSGRGLFSGRNVSLKMCPAEADFKIAFQREDIVGSPLIYADIANVTESIRCTSLNGEKGVQTVEHLLSAVYAYGIDNLLIRVNGPEIVCGDGSAGIFAEAIERAGITQLGKKKKTYKLKEPVFFTKGDTVIMAIPSDTFEVSYVLHYPDVEVLRSQYFSMRLDPKKYKDDIAYCRTFSTYEDIKPLLDNGLLKGGDLDNAVLIKDGKVVNPAGLKYPDEMVRHKILDLIGDFSLIGKNFTARVIAIRSGHFTNVVFAGKLNEKLILEKE